MANHKGYFERMSFVHTLLSDTFHLQRGLAEVEPIAYDEECPFPYNNFVYSIVVPAGSQLRTPPSAISRIGWERIPLGITKFVIRLANAAAFGVSSPNRVENEVAMLHLSAAALRPLGRKLVPSVYGWGSSSDGLQGWILQDFISGTDLDRVLPGIEDGQITGILAEVAEILSAIQTYPLPSTITKIGGLTIELHDGEDRIVSAQAPTAVGGPWDSYKEYYHDKLNTAIAEADASPVIKGWRSNGVREALGGFLQSGRFAALFQNLASTDDKAIVHSDLTPNNLLYNPESGRITALLDYDFAFISHPSSEFLHSFHGLGGPYRGWSPSDDKEQQELQNAKLLGFPTRVSAPSTTPSEDWKVAEAFEHALKTFKVIRPSEMAGYQGIAGLEVLVQHIAPWRLTEPRVVAGQSEDAIQAHKAKCEQQLAAILTRLISDTEFS